MQETNPFPPRAIEQMTPLARDIEICARFGRFPSEFYQLGEDEQEVLRFWFALDNGRQAYRSMPEEDRRHWPRKAPPKPRAVTRRA